VRADASDVRGVLAVLRREVGGSRCLRQREP